MSFSCCWQKSKDISNIISSKNLFRSSYETLVENDIESVSHDVFFAYVEKNLEKQLNFKSAKMFIFLVRNSRLKNQIELAGISKFTYRGGAFSRVKSCIFKNKNHVPFALFHGLLRNLRILHK